MGTRLKGTAALQPAKAAGGNRGETAPAPPLPHVSRESIFNKMNSSNLACVFGPNLIWPSQGASSLSALVPLNMFTELLIEYYEKIFSAPEAPGQHSLAPWERGSRAAPLQKAVPQTQAMGLTKPTVPPSPPMAARRRL
ncbi:rho GTPase-activating protein 8-like [Hylobates moloch]|uniref:rho GTPase-activating protein 8-like n=1 Tax=Hylobates moloch TaxID=81572 RepID=UPI00136294C3|nr:rho GTPase-activating protein 8-like [Hylobates moloch]